MYIFAVGFYCDDVWYTVADDSGWDYAKSPVEGYMWGRFTVPYGYGYVERPLNTLEEKMALALLS